MDLMLTILVLLFLLTTFLTKKDFKYYLELIVILFALVLPLQILHVQNTSSRINSSDGDWNTDSNRSNGIHTINTNLIVNLTMVHLIAPNKN